MRSFTPFVIELPNVLKLNKTYYQNDLLQETVLHAESQIAELDPQQVVKVHYKTMLQGKRMAHYFLCKAHQFAPFMGDAE